MEVSEETASGRCCCHDDKSANHRSLFSRLRNFTDRFSMSFDTREPPVGRTPKQKSLNKCNSIGASPSLVCKRCNLTRIKEPRSKVTAEDKRSMTLPKTGRRAQDCLNKSWRTVFVKEKERRPSVSLEALSVPDDEGATKHRRNLSNPEGAGVEIVAPSVQFGEIDVRPRKPEILVDPVNPGSSGALNDLGKVEIRRSSASMEDISKITKQNEMATLSSSLEQKKQEELQHTGSLDSMLKKDNTKMMKKPTFSSPAATKKSTPSLFSRFKSGMSIDGSKSQSNSGSLHDQQSPSGWISSLTASFRPRRQTQEGAASTSPHPVSPNHEE